MSYNYIEEALNKQTEEDFKKSSVYKIAQENNIPYVFSDYRELLKMNEIDGVDICLPNFLHAPVAIDALEASKHVYCEKPMAKTGAEAQAMYDTAQRTGKNLSVQMGTIFSKETRTAMANLAIDNLEEFFKSGGCKNKVN